MPKFRNQGRREGRWPGAIPAALTALLIIVPPAGAQVRVCVEPADTTIALGDVATVRVTTDGPPADLKGFLVRAVYNPGVLSLQATLPGSVLSGYLYSFYPYAAPPDTLGFDAAVLIGATQGPGTLGLLRIQGISEGICDIVPTQLLMRNSLNEPYPVITCSGRVRVVSPTAAAQTTWGAIKAGLARR